MCPGQVGESRALAWGGQSLARLPNDIFRLFVRARWKTCRIVHINRQSLVEEGECKGGLGKREAIAPVPHSFPTTPFAPYAASQLAYFESFFSGQWRRYFVHRSRLDVHIEHVTL